jgi:hypothetical protein
MARRTGFWDLKGFAASMRALTEGLPTDAEKGVLRGHLQEIISFLSQTQKALDSLPTLDEAAAARRALEALEQLEIRARSSPILSAALGVSPPRPTRPKSSPLAPEEQARAQDLLTELRALSSDDMNARLGSDPSIGTRDLEAIASLVGIRLKRRAGREVLVQQIVRKISNYRGYQELQGRSP